MAIVYLKTEQYKEDAKNFILKYKNTIYNVEFPLSRIFYDGIVDLRNDEEFISELVSCCLGKRILHAFIEYIEKSAYSIKDYGELILELCTELVAESTDSINKQWGLPGEISKLVMSLYDECANSRSPRDINYADKCLDIWDTMFEKQIGYTRELSHQLMER